MRRRLDIKGSELDAPRVYRPPRATASRRGTHPSPLWFSVSGHEGARDDPTFLIKVRLLYVAPDQFSRSSGREWAHERLSVRPPDGSGIHPVRDLLGRRGHR